MKVLSLLLLLVGLFRAQAQESFDLWYYKASVEKLIDHDENLSIPMKSVEAATGTVVYTINHKFFWWNTGFKPVTGVTATIETPHQAFLSYADNKLTVDKAGLQTYMETLDAVFSKDFKITFSGESLTQGTVQATVDLNVFLEASVAKRLEALGDAITGVTTGIYEFKQATLTKAVLLADETLKIVGDKLNNIVSVDLCADGCSFNGIVEIGEGITANIKSEIKNFATFKLLKDAKLIFESAQADAQSFINKIEMTTDGAVEVRNGLLTIAGSASQALGTFKTAADATLELGFDKVADATAVFDASVKEFVNSGLLYLGKGRVLFQSKVTGDGRVKLGTGTEMQLAAGGAFGASFENDGVLQIKAGATTITGALKASATSIIDLAKDVRLAVSTLAESQTELLGKIKGDGKIAFDAGVASIKGAFSLEGTAAFDVGKGGTLNINATATQALSLNAQAILDGTTIIAEGTVNFLKGFATGTESNLRVAAGAILKATSAAVDDLKLSANAVVDGTLEVVAGTLKLNPGAGISTAAQGSLKIAEGAFAEFNAGLNAFITVDVDAILDGKFDIKTGTCTIVKALSGAASGSINVAADAVVDFKAATKAQLWSEWEEGFQLLGDGKALISQGILEIKNLVKLNLEGAIEVGKDGTLNIDLSQGLQIQPKAVVNGALNIKKGILTALKGFDINTGALVEIAADAGLNLGADLAAVFNVNANLANAGKIQIEKGILKIGNAVKINGDGIIEVLKDASLSIKTSADVQVAIDNAQVILGKLTIEEGVAAITGAITAQGDAIITAAQNAQLNLVGNVKHLFNGTAALVLDGLLDIKAGTAEIMGFVDVRGGGTLTVSDGALNIDAAQGLTISAKAVLDGATTIKKGVLTIANGLTKGAGGTLQVAADAGLTFASDVKSSIKSNGELVADGAVKITKGTLEILDSASVAGSASWDVAADAGIDATTSGSLQFGTFKNNGGRVSFANDVKLALLEQSEAAAKLIVGTANKSAVVTVDGKCNFLGGIVSGNGDFGCDANVDGGVVAPGFSPGVVKYTTLTMASNGKLDLEVVGGGTTAGTHHDQVQVTGKASLEGTLAVTLGDAVKKGDSYVLLKAGSIDGKFATVTGVDASAVTYTDTEVKYTAAADGGSGGSDGGSGGSGGGNNLSGASGLAPASLLIASLVAVLAAAA